MRERKYRSGCQCGISALHAEIMRAADCKPFVGQNRRFFPTVSSRRLRFAQTAAYMSRSVSRVLLSYGHLSRRTVAGTLQPPREQPGQPIAPIPVLLRIEFTAADAFTRRRVSSYLAFPPLPAAPQSPQPAVYLCCTCPEVAFGGRYPLFLPCGARTFLMDRLSPLSPRPSDLLTQYNIVFCGGSQRGREDFIGKKN